MKYIVDAVPMATPRKPHFLAKSSDGRVIFQFSEGFVTIINNDGNGEIKITQDDAYGFALWILASVKPQ